MSWRWHTLMVLQVLWVGGDIPWWCCRYYELEVTYLDGVAGTMSWRWHNLMVLQVLWVGGDIPWWCCRYYELEVTYLDGVAGTMSWRWHTLMVLQVLWVGGDHDRLHAGWLDGCVRISWEGTRHRWALLRIWWLQCKWPVMALSRGCVDVMFTFREVGTVGIKMNFVEL